MTTRCTCGHIILPGEAHGDGMSNGDDALVNGCQKCGLNGRSDGGAKMAAAPLAPPRRICLWLLTPAEKAIRAAQDAVEAMPPDQRLTEAGILLQAARDKVADFVDGQDRDGGAP